MAGRFSVEAVFKAVDRITAPVSRMQNRVGKFTRAASKNFDKLNRNVDKFTASLKQGATTAIKWTAVGIGALAAGVGYFVKQFSKVENAEAAFTPLLGGAKKAKEMVEALNETAASTPFQFENLTSAANQLLPVMHGNIQKTIKTVRMLGDTAGGNAQKLDSVTRGYTKAMLKGKVDMESLNMIAEAGVPIFQDLAAVMGTKVGARFFKQISAGRVTTDQLTKAFEKLTGKGGKFFNGMEIASKTTTGLWSTLKDNISLTAAVIGSILAPTVKDLIKDSTVMAVKVRDWVKANRELINTKFLKFVDFAKEGVKSLIKVFEFLNKHVKTIAIGMAVFVALIATLKTLALVIAVVNGLMVMNPIGLLILAIGLAIASLVALVYWWKELKAAFLGLSGPAKGLAMIVTGPVSLLIGAAGLLLAAWDPVKTFFTDLGDIIGMSFDKIVSWGSSAKKFLGLGDDSEPKGAPQMVSPQDRIARSIEEKRTTSSAEVTIKDETGRASVTRGSLGGGLKLQPTGGF